MALGSRGSPFLSHARPRSGTGSRESREGRAPRCLTGAWSRCSAQRLNSEGSRSDSTEALAQAGAAEVLATGAPTPQGLAIRFLFRQGPGLNQALNMQSQVSRGNESEGDGRASRQN